jgi:hypothetical protein
MHQIVRVLRLRPCYRSAALALRQIRLQNEGFSQAMGSLQDINASFTNGR